MNAHCIDCHVWKEELSWVEIYLFWLPQLSVHLAITITFLPRSKNSQKLPFHFITVSKYEYLAQTLFIKCKSFSLPVHWGLYQVFFRSLNGFHSLPFQIFTIIKKLWWQVSGNARLLPTPTIEFSSQTGIFRTNFRFQNSSQYQDRTGKKDWCKNTLQSVSASARRHFFGKEMEDADDYNWSWFWLFPTNRQTCSGVMGGGVLAI